MFSHLPPDPSYLNCSAESLALALEERDRYTRAHCDRVSRLAHRLGRRCDLDATTLAQLTLAALLHDIGKIGIPDHVLNAPHRLSDEDWRLMQSHSERGERIFAASRHPPPACAAGRTADPPPPRGLRRQRLPRRPARRAHPAAGTHPQRGRQL